jgi:hypothetical protein
MEQSVPKRRHIKFRRRGITQKKKYNKSKMFSKYAQMIILQQLTIIDKAITSINSYKLFNFIV